MKGKSKLSASERMNAIEALISIAKPIESRLTVCSYSLSFVPALKDAYEKIAKACHEGIEKLSKA